MRPLFARTIFPAILALAAPLACADVYTWTDASGRLNVSNIAPPEGVKVKSVVHEDAPKPRPNATRPPDAEVQALTERVAELEDQIDRAKRQPPPVPAMPYRAAPPAPPVQVNVTVMPSTPPDTYRPSYAGYVPYPYPGYPGLPYDYCDPTIFGCPVSGYPVGVVVLNSPRFHRFKQFDRFHRFDRVHNGQPFVARTPAAPAMSFHRR